MSALADPRLHDVVLRYVARRVRSHADAEDIAQDVMVRIIRHGDELEDVVRVDAWVQRLAANAIADHFRRAVRRELPSGDAIDRGTAASRSRSPVRPSCAPSWRAAWRR